jgi:hypothetical protein
MAPEVRMRRPIRYKPKDPVEKVTLKTIKPIRTTLKTIPIPRPTMIKPTTRQTMRKKSVSVPRKTLKISPNLLNMNMRSGNMLYDPRQPSPKIQINSEKLFDKIRELQEMLKMVKRKRNKDVSMNHSAKKYLNNTSYEDPLLNASYIDPMDDLKLKGVKGTAFG